MNDLTIEQALRDSVHEVLERMFFIDAQGAPGEKPATSLCTHEVAARLTFQGEPPGSLTLVIACGAARQITADFLGLDEDEVSDGRTAEVVCELANMICGSLLSRVESAATFHLSAPQILPLPEHPSADCGPIRYALELPHGRLAVLVTTGTPTCLQTAPSAY